MDTLILAGANYQEALQNLPVDLRTADLKEAEIACFKLELKSHVWLQRHVPEE